MKKKLISILLCAVMVVGLLSGCGKSDDKKETPSNQTGGEGESDSKYGEFLTIDVFSSVANYQGVQTGWFAKVVKEKFNMELNIIAPNVSGGGDTLYQTRVASGELGDIVIQGPENGKLQEMVTANILMDLEPYIDGREYLTQYKYAMEFMNNENPATAVTQDGLYGVPAEISLEDPTAVTGTEPTFGPYVRWDLYAELGYPEMETLEDLLDVLEGMQELAGETADGQKIYAMSLFKDWDANMLNNAKQPTCYYGYDELGFVLSRADGTDDQSIIDSDSIYVRVLKFFYEANQRGILDPESTTQTYDNLYAKYKNGQVLFAFWPWLGQAAYNTADNMAEGKGFMLAAINDMEIFSYGSEPYGGKPMIGVGANTKDPERMADFIDWLYSPEGVMMNASQTQTICGPEGLCWEMVDGLPQLTAFGREALIDGDADVPEDWGGGSYADGVSAMNFSPIKAKDTNPETGFSYDYTLWPSDEESNPLYDDWREHMGASTTNEFLIENGMVIVATGAGYIAPEESSELSVLRGQIKETLVNASWQMVFAPSDAEFDSILEGMQSTVKGLGYDTVLEFDMNNAADQSAARAAATEDAKERFGGE